ncbi:MAG TPA: SAV_915 family protein [Pseudonocardiaceae bacterium]|jgi:hypothetical protein|nr:SAV_915 family protein [Pseudonocardiaceae bacterium]
MSQPTADRPVVPPMLYVPVRDYADNVHDLTVDFRRLPDGRLALPAYTALDRLVAGCGTAQPWVLLPTAKLDEIAEHTPYDVILLDMFVGSAPAHNGGDGP